MCRVLPQVKYVEPGRWPGESLPSLFSDDLDSGIYWL